LGGASQANRRIVCDTNVIVRLVTDDPPAQAQAARRFLDRAAATNTDVYIPDVVVAELAFVLTSVYTLTVQETAGAIGRLLEHRSVVVDDAGALFTALDLWSVTALDFVDAYLAATTWASESVGVLSFDRDFDRVLGIKRFDPGSR
jgi:predicted nucleic acid-binding protein